MRDPGDDDTLELNLPVGAAPLESPRAFSSLVRVDLGAKTHVGRVRPNNEDAYLVYRTGRYWEKLMTSLPEGDLPGRFDENAYVLAVADGMGGHAAGEVASRLALKTIVNLVLNAVKWALKLDHPQSREAEVQEAMERARAYLRKVDEAVTREASADPTLAGMGTTLTAAYSFGADLFTVHVGDSRAYLFHEDILQQLTHDHTVAQAMADAGQIAPEEVSRHRLRHVLTAAIGVRPGKLEVEVQHHTLADGDRVLLCTDGLTDLVDDAAIVGVLQRTEPSAEACGALVDLALERGGQDNVTVVMARYGIPASPAGENP